MRKDATFLFKASTGIYYFRLLIPKTFQEYLKIKQIRRSLNTRDPTLAKARLNRYSGLISAVFERNLQMIEKYIEEINDLNLDDTIQLNHSLSQSILERIEKDKALKNLDSTTKAVEQLFGISFFSTISRLRESVLNDSDASDDARISDSEALLSAGYSYSTAIAEILKSGGVNALKASMPFFEEEFLSEWSQVFNHYNFPDDAIEPGHLYPKTIPIQPKSLEQLKNELGLKNNTSFVVEKPSPIITKTKETSMKLCSLWADFIRNREKEISSESMMGVKTASKVMLDLMGRDTLVSSIEYEQVQQLNEDINSLPVFAMSHPDYKGLSLKEVINQYKAMEDSPQKPELLSSGQLKTYIKHFKAFFDYANERFIKYPEVAIPKNPLKLLNEDFREDSDCRPFSDSELETIFECFRFDSFKHPREQPKAVDFWSPLFGLFTGMRLAEICQLRLNNVIVNDGIWHINLKHNPKEGFTLKTTTSNRLVPIPKFLMDVGFEEFYKDRESTFKKRPEHTTLFFNLKPSFNRTKADYSDPTSKSFGRLKSEKLGFGKEVNFHSFRRSFINFYKNADSILTEKQIAAIVGHGKKTQTQKYEGDFSLDELQKLMNQFQIQTDTSHIHWNNYLKKGVRYDGYGKGAN